MTATYDDALINAGVSATRFGAALAMFERDLKALAAVTPKCECGWARDHRGPCRRTEIQQ